MSGEYEKLSNVNAFTAKHAQWLVRVLAPRLTEYLFWARGEEVNATRFSAILIAQDDSEYLPVAVRSEFSDPQGAIRAHAKFVENSVWIMRKPIFDPQVRSQVQLVQCVWGPFVECNEDDCSSTCQCRVVSENCDKFGRGFGLGWNPEGLGGPGCYSLKEG